MNLYSLVENLIQAKDEFKRQVLLKKVSKDNFANLAYILRDIYYESWTSNPKRVQKASEALKSLIKISSSEEVKALSDWVSGIANITKGKLELALNDLDNAADILKKINKHHEAAKTQVAKLYVLALLGRYDEAIECGDESLIVFKEFKDLLAVGKVEKNIGNIYWRRDIYDEAEKRFIFAQRCFKEVENFEELTMVEHCLASAYTSQNKFSEAEKVYSDALQHAKTAKMFVTQAEIEASIGNLALFRGKFDQALLFLEKARAKYEELKMSHQVALAELEIADAYLELNLVSEAFEIYKKVSKSLKRLKMQGEEARSRANFGRSAVGLKKYEIAKKELVKSAKLYVAEKNLVGAAVVKLNESQLEISANNYKKAFSLANEAEKLLRKTTNFRHKLTANWIQSECLINFTDYKNAKNLLNKTFDKSIKQENGQIAQVSQISLGKISRLENNIKEAEKHFKKAIELIENLREPLPAEEFRIAFLANKLVPYQQLAEIYVQENRLAEAFEMVERSRSRALSENLSIESKIVVETKNSSKLFKKLEDLREELNWFYSRINRANESEIANLQTEAKKREREITELNRKLNSTTDNLLQTHSLFSLEELQKQLGSKKILIEFVGFGNELSAFIVTNSEIKFVKNLAKESEIAELLEGLHFQFGALRYGAKNLGSFVGELKKRADFYLQKLYEKLIRPFENLLENRNLVIVPFGKLHYIPFNALHNGESYLIENREVSSVASSTVWQFCQSKPSRKTENALLIGFADEKIPLVNQEIETLSKIFENKIALTKMDANFANFKQHAEKFDILHIACHGEFRQDNPMFSALRLADGWITVRDVCAMRLTAELVTLSACETGLNLVFVGEELLGLSRGFLSAGASSLLLTLWNVNDEATQNLMKIFYQEVKNGKSFAESLRIAKLQFIEKNAHPYFWSPFILIGKG